VLRLSAMLSWGQSFLAPDTATGKSVSTLVAGITSSLGVYFTLLMLGMYLPAALLLRERARRVAEGDDFEAREDWLKKHGLAISVADYIPRVLALLGPLLAGPIGELLKNAFTSTP
jgi:membrane protein DedA with SNARE-associated domain